jgi:hypothetical protein
MLKKNDKKERRETNNRKKQEEVKLELHENFPLLFFTRIKKVHHAIIINYLCLKKVSWSGTKKVR